MDYAPVTGTVRRWAVGESLRVALAAMDVCLSLPLVDGLLSYVTWMTPLQIGGAMLGGLLAVHFVARGALELIGRPHLRAAVLVGAILVSATLVVHATVYPGSPILDLDWPVRIVRWLLEANVQSLSIPREGVVFLVVVLVWWRGLELGHRRSSSQDVGRTFRAGVLALCATTGLGSLIVSWPTEYAVFAYFFAGLVAVGLARGGEAERFGGEQRSLVTTSWLATILVAALAVVLGGAALASIVTGTHVALALRPVIVALRALLLAVLFLAGLLAQAIVAIARLLVGEVGLDRLRAIVAPSRALRAPRLESGPSRWSPDQLAALRAAVVAGGGIFLIVLVALSASWLRRRLADRKRGEYDSVWEGVDVRESLARLGDVSLAWLQSRTRRARSQISRVWAALTVRQVYGRVLHMARERGYPRAPNQTPYEFLPTLTEALPGLEDPLTCITEAYVAIHYGEAPEDPQVLRSVRHAWSRIKAQIAGTRAVSERG